MSVEDVVNKLLPFTKEDQKCNEKWMLKDRNRLLLKRILKTMNEKPYEVYVFEIR